jgi:hypothetical protein
MWTVHKPFRLAAGAMAAGLCAFGAYEGVAAITRASAKAPAETPPAMVEPIGKTGINRIVLTVEAAKRLGISTKPVATRLVAGKRLKVVPYSAIVYDTAGTAWVYVRVGTLTFARHRVTVTTVTGRLAVLTSGPRIGTQVVDVGASELLGSEAEFDEDA